MIKLTISIKQKLLYSCSCVQYPSSYVIPLCVKFLSCMQVISKLEGFLILKQLSCTHGYFALEHQLMFEQYHTTPPCFFLVKPFHIEFVIFCYHMKCLSHDIDSSYTCITNTKYSVVTYLTKTVKVIARGLKRKLIRTNTFTAST